MKPLTDTSPEAQRVLERIYRDMPISRKWQLLNDLCCFGRQLHAAGVRQRKPDATPAEVVEDWIARHVGRVPFRIAAEDVVNQPTEMQKVVREVVTAFDRLGINYALGGSLASSIHGVNRNTADADITVEPFPGQENQLVALLGDGYYVSLDAVRQALRDRSCFNLISTTTGYKVDVFVRKDRPFDLSVMRRRSAFHPSDSPDEPIEVVSPEDIVLLKLEWYRMGNEVSERQWSDVLGVLRTQAGRLDEAYLDHWARELGVGDLLTKARVNTNYE